MKEVLKQIDEVNTRLDLLIFLSWCMILSLTLSIIFWSI